MNHNYFKKAKNIDFYKTLFLMDLLKNLKNQKIYF